MSISSDLPNSEVVINENRYELPARVDVTRSRESLCFKILQNDSIINDTMLNARRSNLFWWGNLGQFLYLAPIAWLIDSRNENRFTYGRFIHIDSLGNPRRLNNAFSATFAEVYFRRHQQGNFKLQIALPYANFFHLKPQNETPRNLAGFHGIGIGVEYFYRNNRSLQLRSDGIMTFEIPIPVSFHPEGHREIASSLNINLTDNFHINRFRLGYGLNFARNNWNYQGYESPPYWQREPDDEYVWIPGRFKRNNMLGLALSTHFRFTNRFYFGVIYRPSFFELSLPRFLYEHTISIDFKWKIPL